MCACVCASEVRFGSTHPYLDMYTYTGAAYIYVQDDEAEEKSFAMLQQWHTK